MLFTYALLQGLGGKADGNRLLFFFSGHGHSDADGVTGYLVPTDAPNPNSDRRGFLRLLRVSVPPREVILRALPLVAEQYIHHALD